MPAGLGLAWGGPLMLRQHGAQYLLGIRAGWPWDAMESAARRVYQIPKQAYLLHHSLRFPRSRLGH